MLTKSHHPRAVALAVMTCVGLGLPATAHGAAPTRTKVTGADAKRLELCGAQRSAAVAAVGDKLSVRTGPGRRAARAMIVIERCDSGRWVAAKRLGRGTARFAAPADGDYRLRARGVRGGKAGYLRSGVGEIVDLPFSVDVANQNSSLSLCAPGAPDGATYPVRGHLTGPRTALIGKPSGALYYHGLSYAEFFWRFRAVPGYDTTHELARAGRVSVTVDRLGYGASTAPSGMAVCYGSQADIAKQLVDALKAGTYKLDGAKALPFARVALVGHSAGAFIGEIAAYSFEGIDALGLLSFADGPASPLAVTAVGASNITCATGGEDQDADGPSGYAYFGATEDDFRTAHLNAPTDPAVADAATKMRTRDPCGDLLSIGPAFAIDQIGAQLVSGRVLVMAGEQDALFPPPAVDVQAARMSLGGADVTSVTLPGAGHAITLGRAAPAFRKALTEWLVAGGF